MAQKKRRVESCVVVGAGVVGLAKGIALSLQGHDVTYVETSASRRRELAARGIESTDELTVRAESTIYFVCVPTPSTDDGYDLTMMRQTLVAIGSTFSATGARHLVVVCSTVAPLTTRELVIPTLESASGLAHGEAFDVAAMPEFLRAKSAERDALHPWITVIAAADDGARERLVSLFEPFGGELRASSSFEVAELVKVTHNAYNASKISFFNEIYRLGEALGVNGNEVSEIVSHSAEASLNRAYGIRGGAPFDGVCLPKDLDGLIAFASALGVATPVLRATRETNRSFGDPRERHS